MWVCPRSATIPVRVHNAPSRNHGPRSRTVLMRPIDSGSLRMRRAWPLMSRIRPSSNWPAGRRGGGDHADRRMVEDHLQDAELVVDRRRMDQDEARLAAF